MGVSLTMFLTLPLRTLLVPADDDSELNFVAAAKGRDRSVFESGGCALDSFGVSPAASPGLPMGLDLFFSSERELGSVKSKSLVPAVVCLGRSLFLPEADWADASGTSTSRNRSDILVSLLLKWLPM